MRVSRGTIAALVAIAAAAGLAFADVASLIDSQYGGPMKDVALVQNHLNTLRSAIDQASADDILASRDVARQVIDGKIAGQLRLLRSAFKDVDTTGSLNLKVLSENQINELLATATIYDPELSGASREKMEIQDEAYVGLLGDCADAIEKRGSDFLSVVSSEQPDKNAVQIVRAELTLEMARFDILVAYFILLNEGR